MRNISSHLRILALAVAALSLSAEAVWAGQSSAAPAAELSRPASISAADLPAFEVQGHERLAWEQQASSPEELAGFGFVAYVNGQPRELPSVECASEPGPGGFGCTSPLPELAPGVHLVEVAAYRAGAGHAEGLRSAPIQVRFGVSAEGSAVAANWSDQSRPSSMDRSWTTSDGVWLRATEVASGLEDQSDLLPLPDGRVLVAERAGRVRVYRDGVLLEAPAVTLDDVAVGEGRGLLALAVDRAFQSTRHVFALYTTTDGLRVVRFSVFGDRLVDPAVLLEGLPVAAVQPAALLRSGPDGRLYLALDDGGDVERLHDLGSYSGKVLRFSTDGTTPDDQPSRSPVWAVGVRYPVGLSWSVERGTLRLVGVERLDVVAPQVSTTADMNLGNSLTRFSLTPDVGASRAATTGSLVPALRDNMLVASAAERAILRVWFTVGDVPGGSEWLLRDLPGPVTALTVTSDGTIYAAVGPVLLRISGE